MAVLKPRNRIVYFRLSEDEFESLRTYCETYGARSVSDLARTAVLDAVQSPRGTNESELLSKLREIDDSIGQLSQKLDAFGNAETGS